MRRFAPFHGSGPTLWFRIQRWCSGRNARYSASQTWWSSRALWLASVNAIRRRQPMKCNVNCAACVKINAPLLLVGRVLV